MSPGGSQLLLGLFAWLSIAKGFAEAPGQRGGARGRSFVNELPQVVLCLLHDEFARATDHRVLDHELRVVRLSCAPPQKDAPQHSAGTEQARGSGERASGRSQGAEG